MSYEKYVLIQVPITITATPQHQRRGILTTGLMHPIGITLAFDFPSFYTNISVDPMVDGSLQVEAISEAVCRDIYEKCFPQMMGSLHAQITKAIEQYKLERGM